MVTKDKIRDLESWIRNRPQHDEEQPLVRITEGELDVMAKDLLKSKAECKRELSSWKQDMKRMQKHGSKLNSDTR